MARKMIQLVLFASLALAMMAFTVLAQKTGSQKKAAAKETARKNGAEVSKKSTSDTGKKESDEAGKKIATPQLVHTGDLTRRPTLTITDVTKKDSVISAVKGQNRTIQVDAKMKVTLPAGAKLKVVEWILTTVNSDGSTSRGTKTWNAGNLADELLTCTIDLPMAKGIIAERFTLSATAEIIHEGVAKKISTSKSGNFAR